MPLPQFPWLTLGDTQTDDGIQELPGWMLPQLVGLSGSPLVDWGILKLRITFTPVKSAIRLMIIKAERATTSPATE